MLFGWWRSPERRFSHPPSSPSDSSSTSSSSSLVYTFSGTFHISCSSKGLLCPLCSPLWRCCPELCEGLRIDTQSPAKDRRRQDKLTDLPFYRACCLPLEAGRKSFFLCQPKTALMGEFYKKERPVFPEVQLPATAHWQVTSQFPCL